MEVGGWGGQDARTVKGLGFGEAREGLGAAAQLAPGEFKPGVAAGVADQGDFISSRPAAFGLGLSLLAFNSWCPCAGWWGGKGQTGPQKVRSGEKRGEKGPAVDPSLFVLPPHSPIPSPHPSLPIPRTLNQQPEAPVRPGGILGMVGSTRVCASGIEGDGVEGECGVLPMGAESWVGRETAGTSWVEEAGRG